MVGKQVDYLMGRQKISDARYPRLAMKGVVSIGNWRDSNVSRRSESEPIWESEDERTGRAADAIPVPPIITTG